MNHCMTANSHNALRTVLQSPVNPEPTLNMLALRMAALRLHWKIMPPQTVPMPLKITSPVNMICTPQASTSSEDRTNGIVDFWQDSEAAEASEI